MLFVALEAILSKVPTKDYSKYSTCNTCITQEVNHNKIARSAYQLRERFHNLTMHMESFFMCNIKWHEGQNIRGSEQEQNSKEVKCSGCAGSFAN